MLYEIKNLRCTYDKHYTEGVSKVVLNIEHLVIPRGKKIFIVGESGIGKSTILEVLGMMNNTIIPDNSTVFRFYEKENTPSDLLNMWKNNDDDELSDFRRKHFNFIFQSTNLMRNFTAFENISITRMLQGYSQKEAFAKALPAPTKLNSTLISFNHSTFLSSALITSTIFWQVFSGSAPAWTSFVKVYAPTGIET